MFVICPLKLAKMTEAGPDYSYLFGDEGLLLGAVLKKTFLYYVMLHVTQYNVKLKTIFSKFSVLWTEYAHAYSKLGRSSKPDPEMLSSAYDSVAQLRTFIPEKSDVAIVDMSYIKALNDFDVLDTIDVVLVHKIGKTKETELELITIDPDITRPSRTSFVAKLRNMMQEVMVRRELASHDVRITSSVLNLYTGQKVPVSLKREHRLNYKRALRQICRAIDSGVDYPTPSKFNCSKCIFDKECVWAEK